MRLPGLAGFVLFTCAALPGTGPQAQKRLVELDVVAVTNGGEPVGDLDPGEVRIADDGQPEAIATFHHASTTPWTPPSLGPGERANRTSSEPPHATVILFDLLNEGFTSWSNASRWLVRDLEHLRKTGPLYFYFLTAKGELFAVAGVPGTDGAGLPGADDVQPGWNTRADELTRAALKAVAGPSLPSNNTVARVQLTYTALAQLAIKLSRVAGRKNVVWITNGVPLSLPPSFRTTSGSGVDYTSNLRQLSLILNRYLVSIYPVRQAMGGANPGGSLADANTLDQLAGITGGRPDRGKDIGPALTQAMNDVEGSYQIGYYEPAEGADGSFRKLRVTSARKGVRIQAKNGYYNWPEPAEGDAHSIMSAAMETHFDAAEIALRGVFVPNASDPRQSRFTGLINARDITFLTHADHSTAHLKIALVNYYSNARVEDIPVEPTDLVVTYSPDELEKIKERGIPFDRTFAVGRQTAKVRLIVLDANSEAIGSLGIPVPSVPQQDWR